jgi:hypothetical protein
VKSRLAILSMIGLALAARLPAARADDAGLIDSSGWHSSAQIYAWAFGDTGDLTIGGRTAHLDDSFLDTMKKSDSLLAFMGHFEAQYDRFGGFVDGSYANIKSSAEAGPVSADITEELLFIEAGGFYRAVENLPLWQAPQTGGGVLTVDALAGARYTRLSLDGDAELDAIGADFSTSRDRDWVDPFIGARALLALTDRFDLIVRGDVGGFGVGADISANGMALVGYHFGLGGDTVGEVWGGYRALYQDYDSGSFAWDMVLHGPIIGFTVRW